MFECYYMHIIYRVRGLPHLIGRYLWLSPPNLENDIDHLIKFSIVLPYGWVLSFFNGNMNYKKPRVSDDADFQYQILNFNMLFTN